MFLRASNGDTCVSNHGYNQRDTNGNEESDSNQRTVSHYDLWPRSHPRFEPGASAMLRSMLVLKNNGASEFIHQRWTYLENSVRQTLHGYVYGIQAKYHPNSALKPSHNFWFDQLGMVEEMFYYEECTFEITSILYDPMQYPGIGARHEFMLKDGAEKYLNLKLHEFKKYLELVRRLP